MMKYLSSFYKTQFAIESVESVQINVNEKGSICSSTPLMFNSHVCNGVPHRKRHEARDKRSVPLRQPVSLHHGATVLRLRADRGWSRRLSSNAMGRSRASVHSRMSQRT